MVNQTPLKNHPGMWLAPDAAASLERYENDHGVIPINEAGRSKAVQDGYLARWAKGGAANRPPYLYQPGPSSGPNVSWHILGEALDTPARNALAASLAPYGWTFDIASDVVHAQYHPTKDQHAGGGGSSPSQDVKNRQQAINDTLHLGLVVDGINGPKTKEGTKQLQAFLRAYGYTAAIDGIWGAGTEAAWATYVNAGHQAAPVPAAPGKALSYADIQAGLNKFGYGLAVDNIWGPKSHNALGDFQSKHGLVRDYLVGPKTRAALGI